jgi:hypothetical protein
MPANLLIANCGIPLDAIGVGVNNTQDSRFIKENLFGGNKVDSFRLATATSGDTRLTFSTSGKTANFLYLGKALTLKNDDVGTITVKAHSADVYGSATTITTLSSFGSTTLMGPDSDDYVTTFATSSSFPYWYVNYNASAASLILHSKCFFGTYVDPGKDPTGSVSATRIRPTGARRRAAYTFELSWEGLTYAKAVEMYQKFYRNRRHNPIILFTTSYHDILFGHKVLFGRVLDMTVPPRQTDYCDVTMSFEEIV